MNVLENMTHSNCVGSFTENIFSILAGFCRNPSVKLNSEGIEKCEQNVVDFVPVAMKTIFYDLITNASDVCSNHFELETCDFGYLQN